jgi:hypothetical protein
MVVESQKSLKRTFTYYIVENHRSIFKATDARKIPVTRAVTPSILCIWELNTKCGVVLATSMEEAWVASKNVDHRKQWDFRWLLGSMGSPNDFHFSASTLEPKDEVRLYGQAHHAHGNLRQRLTDRPMPFPMPTQPMLKEFQPTAIDFETPTESKPARATSQESKWPF